MWIAAISRGHNASVCLLKDGEIVFSIEEERLSRHKYDGGPLAAMVKILDYTDKLDYLVIAHTQALKDTAGKIDFTGDDVYTGLARKLGLIDRKANIYDHPQVIDLSYVHHKLHAACAFYRSGFETATAVIVDGAGTFIPMNINNEPTTVWELETIFECEYPNNFQTVYKHVGGRGPWSSTILSNIELYEQEQPFDLIVDENAGIVKAYEAVTQYCGWNPIEAGKTMGLFPYGKPNEQLPTIYNKDRWISGNRNIIVPTYPNGAVVNEGRFEFLETSEEVKENNKDLTQLESRRDMAYAVQTESQRAVLSLIKLAVERTGNKNVVVSGGYGLNCVANYYYLKELKDLGINLYVEPISNDAGTAIGAAYYWYHNITGIDTVKTRDDNLYLGPTYVYSDNDIAAISKKYEANIADADHETLVDLITTKNIVAVFQGRSENGPRALGNRSLVFDPTFEDGKDFVNTVKRREYFRPFAGSILEEDAHEWFDLRGMDSSPTMMYAVNCQSGVEEKIPSIIHVDGTCRIQTVNREQNPHYYDIIKAFKERTGVPIVFNTSFNLGGEPLVETLEDALWTLQQSDIEYLYLPEYSKILSIKNR
jgi:carbamoyltransferase